MKKLMIFVLICAMAVLVGCAGAQVNTYTVAFDGNGQPVSIAAQTVEEGGKAEEPEAPSAEGYDFGGWYMNAECTGEAYDFDSAVMQDITLYARWTRSAEVQSVSTAEEFFAMSSGNYRLENDIDFSGVSYRQVGSLEQPFSGTLDGAGHTLKNISGTFSAFGCVTGTVKNLTAEIRVEENAASGTVYSGFVGFLKGGRIENCIVNGSIEIQSSDARLSVYAGGVAGRSAGGTVEKCTSNADISVANTAEVYAGGVVGYNGGEAELDAQIVSSAHYGNVSAAAKNDTAAAYAGGVAGYNAGTVRDCFDVSVLVKASCGDYHAFAGGVAGDNNGGSLIRCFSAADVTCETAGGDTFMGGVSGRNFLDYAAEDCYGWNGQNFTLTYTGEILPSARHLRVPCETVSAASLNDSAWYEKLGLEGWIVEDGFLPRQQSVAEKSFARAASYGTIGNPIKIGTAEELRAMESGKAYVLTANIQLGDWSPLGTYQLPFCGSLDGAGHRVYGVAVRAESGYAGLFGYLNGTVKNLNVEISCTVTDSSDKNVYAGGIAGYGMNAVIENCNAEVSFAVNAEGAVAGGICGYGDGVNIFECSASGTVEVNSSNPSAYAAGVCAVSENGTVARCAASVSVSAFGTDGSAAAGIVAKNGGTVEDCYSTDAAIASSNIESGNVYAGGVVALNNGTLANSFSIGQVIGGGGTVAAAGTVCGANYGDIRGCYAQEVSDLGTLGYSAELAEAYAVSAEELADLADTLDASRGVWVNGENGYPVLAWQEA